MSASVRRGAMAWGVAFLLASALARVAAHPIHATLTELRYDAAKRTVEASIRVFAEDLRDALKREGTAARANAGAADYARSRFALYDRGQAVGLESCGARLSGDLLWLCLVGHGSTGLEGLTVSNRLLFELFNDQVNIVQATAAGRRVSLLFTKGEGAKPLR